MCARTAAQSINKVADIIETQQSKVELSKVLGIKAFDLEKMLEQDPEFLDMEQVRLFQGLAFAGTLGVAVF